MPLLISADALARRLDDERARRAGARTVVLDVRRSLAAPDGAPAFREGHVPGNQWSNEPDRPLATGPDAG